jgi:hypothetical protein
LGKIIGRKWRELSAVERKVYEKLAEKDSVRYRKEMEAYNDFKTKKLDEDEKRSSTLSFTASSAPAPVDQQSSRQTQSYDISPSSFRQEQNNSSNVINRDDSFTTSMGRAPSSAPQQDEFPSHQSAPSHPAPIQGVPAPYPFASTEAPQSSYQPQYSVDSGMQRSQGPPPNSHHTISVPPAPPGVEPVNSSSFPMPPGMEVVLSDRSGKERKYRVQYTCYSMTRDAAQKYMENMTGAPGNGVQATPPSTHST